MNRLEKTYQDMVKNSLSFLNDTEKVWTKIEVIREDVAELLKIDKEIDEAAKVQNDSTPEGKIAQKRQDMAALGKSFYRMGRNLCNLAKKTNNQVLLKAVDISESGFISGEEKELILRFRAVLAAARLYVTELVKYNVAASDLDALDTRLALIVSMPETISVANSQRKSATRTIKELNSEARIILDRLDDAIEGMINDDKYIENWFDVRKIKGRHVSSKKSNGNGAEGKQPLK